MNPERLENLCKDAIGLKGVCTNNIPDLIEEYNPTCYGDFSLIGFLDPVKKYPVSLFNATKNDLYNILGFERRDTKYGLTFIVYAFNETTNVYNAFWSTEMIKKKLRRVLYLEFETFQGISIIPFNVKFRVVGYKKFTPKNDWKVITYPVINFY